MYQGRDSENCICQKIFQLVTFFLITQYIYRRYSRVIPQVFQIMIV